MKKFLSILVTMIALSYSPTSFAFHGAISSTQIVQFCSSNCNPISSLTVGSVISLNAQMDVLGYS